MLLKIDVDTQRKLSLAALRRRARIAHVEILSCTDTRSPSGRGWHRLLDVERVEQGRSVVRKVCTEKHDRHGICPRCRYDYFGRSTMPFSALEVVALQLLFGSDPIREAFNLHRARLVDARQVPPFWRRRFNTLYATHNGKEYRKKGARSA